MAALKQTVAATHPRCDGRHVLFEVIDKDRSVACAISLNALQDLSEQRCFRPADLLKCFTAVRIRIEAIALGKLRAQSEGVSGVLHIWSDDIDDRRRPVHPSRRGRRMRSARPKGHDAIEPYSPEPRWIRR